MLVGFSSACLYSSSLGFCLMAVKWQSQGRLVRHGGIDYCTKYKYIYVFRAKTCISLLVGLEVGTVYSSWIMSLSWDLGVSFGT